MTSDSNKLLLKQWQTLHNSHENYESYALIIKLFATAIFFIAYYLSFNPYVLLLLLGVLWLQEGIWKTYQQRTVDSIHVIEEKLAINETEQVTSNKQVYLMYSDWENRRPSAKSLIAEYISNALKPTVLYPYVPLIILVLLLTFI